MKFETSTNMGLTPFEQPLPTVIHKDSRLSMFEKSKGYPIQVTHYSKKKALCQRLYPLERIGRAYGP
jgi:hypothetical protein